MAVMVMCYLAGFSTPFLNRYVALFLLLTGTFFATYASFNYLLRIFIYRKIKPIYKAISRLKSGTTRTEKLDIDRDVIAEVNIAVARWEEERDEEIAELKKLE